MPSLTNHILVKIEIQTTECLNDLRSKLSIESESSCSILRHLVSLFIKSNESPNKDGSYKTIVTPLYSPRY
jgi:hypothetical protein